MLNLIPQANWYRPLSPFDAKGGFYAALNSEMDRYFDEFGGLSAPKETRTPPLRMSVSETDTSIEIEAELPGVDEKDIELELSGDLLTIKGEKRVEHSELHKGFFHQERTFGKFARSVTLPFEPDPKLVKTHFARGVLKITLPKSAGVKEHTVRIPVKAAA
jgi:HSP20 family protein